MLQLVPLFERHGVELWLPEAHGSINIHEPAHRALVILLGAHPRREVSVEQPDFGVRGASCRRSVAQKITTSLCVWSPSV
jgi:hypothetical protein